MKKRNESSLSDDKSFSELRDRLPELLLGVPPEATRDEQEEDSLEALEGPRMRVLQGIRRKDPEMLNEAIAGLRDAPGDAELLLAAAIGALFANKPDVSLRYLHRFTKRFVPDDAEHHLIQAIALAQQNRWSQAAQILKKHGRGKLSYSILLLPAGLSLRTWGNNWLSKIERWQESQTVQLRTITGGKSSAARVKQASTGKKAANDKQARAKNAEANGAEESGGALLQAQDDARQTGAPAIVLPRFEARIPVSVVLPENVEAPSIEATEVYDAEQTAFRLRYELSQLGLLQGFDELLCLPSLHNVEAYWYQTEAVRKVLKQFRGRVLLADEVGLGKTIEAGMVLKEYLLRGMASQILVLTPATLVGQWQEEMQVKFGVDFATSYSPTLRRDAAAFWSQPRVIASIATARRPEHLALLSERNYDLVIVDEAHHLKNRQTQNWKLVNALQKRFLLLLSATPVQNSLVELYNLLTLLKPGIFKTEKEFRQSYMTAGKPRMPANRDRMRDLMRDVMIRNTRSLVDVRLPLRHAMTIRLDPNQEETACYSELSALVQQSYQVEAASRRMALRHLLSAAGSTPATAAKSITRFATGTHSRGRKQPWRDLASRYDALAQQGPTGKEKALLELLKRNPDEKKIVFVHHRETIERLSHLMETEGIPCVRFEGSMTGPEKDHVIEIFREEVPLLLSTESGGEGRNLQFCNTLINFDLPWNPMAIEQRIGRIHRIGQAREVFVFNMVVRGTVEEHVLRILDEKINMFELVVGEIDQILGELEDESDFAELIFKAWAETTLSEREAAFNQLGERMAQARQQYESVKQLDEELFGDEFVAA
jgi:superfamily II DNA or RNA helicase